MQAVQPGDFLKFLPTRNCGLAAEYDERHGGQLDELLEVSITLTIPPEEYHLCFAYFPQGGGQPVFDLMPVIAQVFYEPPSLPPMPPPHYGEPPHREATPMTLAQTPTQNPQTAKKSWTRPMSYT